MWRALVKSFELAVGYAVEVSDGCEGLDVGGSEFVGAALLSPVHCIERCLIVLYKAEFQYELSPSDEAFVGFSPGGGHVDTINVNAK